MTSNDIHTSVNKRIVESITGKPIESFMGIPIVLAFQSPVEKAQKFKQALLDYSIEKLADTEENKVVVEDLEYVISRLNYQFSWDGEQEEFYKNYAYCILDAYGELIGTQLTWQDVSVEEKGEFPRIMQEHFQIKPATSYEEATIWLYKKFEQELKRKNPPKTKQKVEKHRWW